MDEGMRNEGRRYETREDAEDAQEEKHKDDFRCRFSKEHRLFHIPCCMLTEEMQCRGWKEDRKTCPHWNTGEPDNWHPTEFDKVVAAAHIEDFKRRRAMDERRRKDAED